ncbi:MAG: MvaI/BcnI family restriction endonuclease [Pseudomonadota bacterium]|nr:MvaI/BcnI family restriction endonuclease [Pseudomonadota bacterium]
MIETIPALVGLLRSHGAHRFYAKRLSPNDNSKNQVYLGGDFSALNIIPHQKVYVDDGDIAGSKRDRAKAKILFSWVDEDVKHPAPYAQLILYPKYPEVRMSGFLRGCRDAPAAVMRNRDEGRVMFFGVTHAGEVLGYAVGRQHPLAREIHGSERLHENGVFLEIPSDFEAGNTKSQLLASLKRIYQKHWIQSKRLGPDNLPQPYKASNGGGYTLEAELGIPPNGHAKPDYLGWEIKQFGVEDFIKFRAKGAVTLMTPEPTGGLYRDVGVLEFMKRYAYPDPKGKPDRFNLGGTYRCTTRDFHHRTGLRLELHGYDTPTGIITDMTGGLVLSSRDGNVAAMWGFTKMMKHWNRKHAQVVYVPSLRKKSPPEYCFGPKVFICEQTDFTLFLKAVSDGIVYYQPGIKMERASEEKPAIKRRSQFRIKYSHVRQMYHEHAQIEL